MLVNCKSWVSLFFEKSDISSLVHKIVHHREARPLAVAIAEVVAAAPDAQRQQVLLGAVLGAHAARGVSESDAGLVLFGAINGAAQAQTTPLTQEFLAQGKALEWVRR